MQSPEPQTRLQFLSLLPEDQTTPRNLRVYLHKQIGTSMRNEEIHQKICTNEEKLQKYGHGRTGSKDSSGVAGERSGELVAGGSGGREVGVHGGTTGAAHDRGGGPAGGGGC